MSQNSSAHNPALGVIDCVITPVTAAGKLMDDAFSATKRREQAVSTWGL